MNRQNVFVAACASAITALALIAAPACGQLFQDKQNDRSASQTKAPATIQLAQATPEPRRVVPTSQIELKQSFAPIVSQTAPAVVNVFATKIVQQASPYANDPFFNQFFGGRADTQPRTQQSLGSGVIVGADGVIVTNNHVIEAGDEFKVVLSDRREYPAELVLADARTDLAVLKIDVGKSTLPTLAFADTRNVQVGDVVLAIGNPFGVGQTVTSGIVSALARTDVGISDYSFFIQTDASINPGNSGGALVDMSGRLVGVNSAIFSRGGGSNGIGFAIPSEMVRRVVDAAMHGGQLVRPWIGVKGVGVDTAAARTLGLARPQGIRVTDVYPGSPGEKAGLKAGDVILSIEDREVFDERGLKFVAATMSPGATTKLKVLRGGQQRDVPVKLAAPPGATEADLKRVSGRNPFSGAAIAEMSPALAEELGLDPFQANGLMVFSVPRGSIASELGLRPGDILREVNGAKIRTAKDLSDAIDRTARGGQGVWRMAIERNGKRNEISVRV